MYLISAGCSSWLHLGLQFPFLVGALTFGGLATQVQSNPGPGDRYGTAQSLTRLQNKIVVEHPELAAKTAELRVNFNNLDAKPTEDQVRLVLKQTDSCTDINVQDLSPSERHEIAWILYIDSYAREGPVAAREIFSSLKR
jgi:hypothetical protein